MVGNSIYAHNPAPPNGALIHKDNKISFIQNNGQWISDAKYKAGIPGGAMFLTNEGFVYNFYSEQDMHDASEKYEAQEDLSNEIIHYHSYRINFVGANSNPVFKGDEKRSNYNNYFIGNDKNKWAGRVPLFGSVEQADIYPGIQAKVYSKGTSVKYDFIVSANANPNQIKLQFEGVSPKILPNGDLQILTTVNEIIEQKPYCYQTINGNEVVVNSKYVLKNNTISFEFPDGYNTNLPLIIDPQLIFATYSGAVGQSAYSYSTTFDNTGSLYAGADSWGTGWPTTIGAYQSSFAGGAHDVGINKYTSLGNALVYSTYYGGSGADYPNAMFVNNLNELIVVGNTVSSNLPHTSGCYDSTYNGGTDIFVAHFTNDGTALIGSTYIGTSASEPGTFSLTGSKTSLTDQNTSSPLELNVDATGNIWVIANTTSALFPVTANAYQSTLSGGMDGVIFALNPTCSNLVYSTYLGGSSNEALFGIQFNAAGNVVVCGVTQSTNFPTTAGVLHTAAIGGLDGFVSIINPTTGGMVASTYLGTTSTDQAVNLQISPSNDIYILGRTLGNYPITTGVYSVPDGDLFVDRLSSDLTTSLLSTRLGTSQSGTTRIFPTAFLLDQCQNVYIAGLGSSSSGNSTILPSGMPLSLDAIQTTPNNFYFGVLKPYFSGLLFGSYYGSTNDDHTHTGVNRLDPDGKVYHSVCSAASNFPVYPVPGVYGPTKLNTGQDIISFKFDFDANGVKSHPGIPVTTNDTGCVPYTINFLNNSTSPYSITNTWTFGDGGTSNLSTPTHTFTTPGVYDVILHAHSDSACITDDYDTIRIVVLLTTPPQISVSDTIVCQGVQSIDLKVDIANPSPNTTIQWGPTIGIISGANQDLVTVNPAMGDTYYVIVKDTIPGICGFSASDTVHIDYSPRYLNIVTNDTTVCQGVQVPIVAIGPPGFDFNWSPAIGVDDTSALNPVITVNTSTTYTLTAKHSGCPDTALTLTINMQPTPIIDLGPDKEVCQRDQVKLESLVTPYRNDYIYSWTPTSGLSFPTLPNTKFYADTTISYTLDVKTPIGCEASKTINVVVHPGNFGSIVADTGFCPPHTVQLWAAGGTRYQWTPAYGLDNANIANPKANPATTTDYSVLITDSHGCLDTQKVEVQIYPLAVIEMPNETTIYSGESYQVHPNTNALYFSWFPPSGMDNTDISDPTFNPEVRTRYFVTATTENGCSVTDSIDVLVDGTVIDMPNAFTPGNGINNTFKAVKRGIVKLNEFSIFNRWGNKVFSTTDINQGWDGTYKGKAQPMGTYIYIIDAVKNDGSAFKKEGNVTLIR